jgi:uncharacterized repeat protein (TIGR03803 family)
LPQGPLTEDADGNFYGTTANGGAKGFGTVFRFSIISPPKFIAAKALGNTVVLTWHGNQGGVYQMACKTNLAQASWANLGSTIMDTNPIMTSFDAVSSGQQRFYQIRMAP